MHQLKRHLLPVSAHFDSTLVLAYAVPQELLKPLLSPGLELDCFGEFGFVAVAMVQTRALRPTFLPPMFGQSFFLSGYRIFTRYTTKQGRHLRGLQILRSDTDKPLMRIAGNFLTHYNYCLAKVHLENAPQTLRIEVQTPRRVADLKVVAHLDETGVLPDGSPFPDIETARRFAGPLPYTFDFERQTGSMILVKGVRKAWEPKAVRVEVERATFFDRFGGQAKLANAFYLSDVPYRWEVGRVEKLAS
jgi:hypothetical protein